MDVRGVEMNGCGKRMRGCGYKGRCMSEHNGMGM